MPGLVHQRCFNHGEREAAARCPRCSRFFCRECVTEFEDRVVCTACLKAATRVPLRERPGLIRLTQLARGLLAFLVAWFFFFIIGETLSRIPASFHDGTVWQVPWVEVE